MTEGGRVQTGSAQDDGRGGAWTRSAQDDGGGGRADALRSDDTREAAIAWPPEQRQARGRNPGLPLTR
jgi:hypothetical protein